MKCTDFEDRLNDVLDLRLSPEHDPALQAHAEACVECRELLVGQELLLTGLALGNRAMSAPDFGHCVLAELQPHTANIALTPVATESHRWNWFTLLSSAAAILLAVSFGVWIANQDGEPTEAGARSGKQQGRTEGLAVLKPGTIREKSTVKPAPKLTPTLPPEKTIVGSTPPTPSLETVPSPAPSDLDRETYRQAMQSIASHWPQAGQWSQAQWSQPAQWPPVETLNVQQVEQYAPSIRPIRESFEVALDALLRTLPGKRDTTRPTQPQALQLVDELLHIA